MLPNISALLALLFMMSAMSKQSTAGKISSIGYKRVFEETVTRSPEQVLQYKSRFLGDFDLI